MILGRNINTKHGFVTVAKHARDTNADICQIFLSSPHTFKATTRKKEELKLLANELTKYKVQIVIHGKFILNFCHPVGSDMHTQSIKMLIADLNDSVILKALGVIIHMGHNTCKLTNDDALNNYVAGLKSVLKESDPLSIIILETGSGQGKEIGTDLVELGKIRNMLTDKEKHRVKFCLDTCHMHAAGYDLGYPSYVEMLEGYIGLNLGWSNIAVVHLNDSKNRVNCRVDRHADIGKGKIEIEGLTKFIEICNKHKVPMLLETPAKYFENELGEKYRYTHKMQLEYIRNILPSTGLILPKEVLQEKIE